MIESLYEREDYEALMKWIIDYALNRCVISIYAWAMLGFTQPYKASRVKPLLVLEITTRGSEKKVVGHQIKRSLPKRIQTYGEES